MIIALMGNDGSGKTTLAKLASEFFSELGFETEYRHEYKYFILGHILSRLGRTKLENARNEMLHENIRSLKYRLWPFLVWSDGLVLYTFLKLFKRRAIMILDRYPYDQNLSFKYLGHSSEVLEWLYRQFPRPDIGIVLTADPHLAYERKKHTHSFSLLFYQKQTKEYVNFAEELKLPLVRTDKALHDTLINLFLLFGQDRNLGNMMFNKGMQNRTIFHVLRKYNLFDQIQFKSLKESYERRIEMAATTIRGLKELLRSVKVNKYAIIKTIDKYGFIGNDIDVLVGSDGLRNIYQGVGSGKIDLVEKIRYDIKKDKGKMDILVKNGMGIDVHSHLGIGLGRNWRIVPNFQFEDLRQYVTERHIYKINCSVIDEKANAIIIIYHILEKGFVTYEDYLFLSQNWDRSFLQNKYIIARNLPDYIDWIEKIMKERPKIFPLFVPLLTLFKSYLKIVVEDDAEKFWRTKLLFWDFSIINFWRIRYFFLGKLPFQINQYAKLWISKSDEIVNG
jgi:thymidylate kinase